MTAIYKPVLYITLHDYGHQSLCTEEVEPNLFAEDFFQAPNVYIDGREIFRIFECLGLESKGYLHKVWKKDRETGERKEHTTRYKYPDGISLEYNPMPTDYRRIKRIQAAVESPKMVHLIVTMDWGYENLELKDISVTYCGSFTIVWDNNITKE